jgi:hypothetical protein
LKHLSQKVPTKPDIIVGSRATALLWQFPKPWAVISIGDYRFGMPPKFTGRPNFKGVLRLEFDDLERPTPTFEGCKLFDKSMAAQVPAFLRLQLEGGDT